MPLIILLYLESMSRGISYMK